MIDYYIVEFDKYFNYYYCKIDKEKIIDYTIINDRIVIVHKFIDFDFDNFDWIIAKSF